VENSQNGPFVNDSRKEAFTKPQQAYQQVLLEYIVEAGISLRSHADTGTVLERLAAATCAMPGFHSAALYLYDRNAFWLIAPGSQREQPAYLQRHALSMPIVTELMSDEYRIDRSYVIPSDKYDALLYLWEFAQTEHARLLDDSGADAASSLAANDLIVVPLYAASGSLLGLLLFASLPYQAPLSIEIVRCLELFANQVALIIEQKQLHEEIRRISEERVALIEVSHALSAPDALQDLQAVYKTIYEQVKRIMPVDIFFINRHNPKTGELVRDFMVENGVSHSPSEPPIVPASLSRFLRVEQGVIFSTAQEFKEHMVTDHPDLRDTTRNFWDRPALAPIQSRMFHSIKYADEPVGLLAALSYQPYCYTQQHLQMLREIGIQAVIAIKSVQMYTELRDALTAAQASERLKNHFLMVASHELRTPLTSIQGYLELLSEFDAALPQDAKANFVNNARRACEELVLLLRNVMDTSRIDQDKVELKVGSVCLRGAVQTIVEILEPLATREQRVIDVSIPERLEVWADDLRLRQILLNLVGNALKHTPVATRVAIGARKTGYDEITGHLAAIQQASRLSVDRQYVVIEVRDWGPGIAPQDQELLFTKFMRLNAAINSAQRGAGLGLYLCRQLTEAMSGHTWVESTGVPGEGTTFLLVLPASQA
jgi:signal transduction histidine kinase